MWPVIIAATRTYAPYIVFPAAVVVGAVGYLIETKMVDKDRGKIQSPSTLDARGERQLDALIQDPTDVSSLRERKDIPRSVLDRNLNPGVYPPS